MKDEGPFYKLTQGDDKISWSVEEIDNSPPNSQIDHLQIMHLICFILLFVATGPSGRGDLMILNMKLTKTFFSFLSIPYYIYIIC